MTTDHPLFQALLMGSTLRVCFQARILCLLTWSCQLVCHLYFNGIVWTKSWVGSKRLENPAIPGTHFALSFVYSF